jgi:TonB-linked SusC/RagA family outer membrane protein
MQSRAHFTLASLRDIQKEGWSLSSQMLLNGKCNWIQQSFHFIFRKQNWLVMKLTAILLLSACLQISAKGFSQDVTLSEKNVSLQKIFHQIHKQTGYQFFYEDEMLNKAGRINIKVTDMRLEKVLAICFKGLPLSYAIVNNVITLKRKTEDLVQAIEAPAFINIKGTVKDAQAQPLAGVSVIVKGTNRGTSTTADGSFLIDASAEDVLEFTFVGYQTQTLSVGKETEINVVLKLDVTGLSDVVIVGFGTQKKVSLTAAVSQIAGSELTKRPVSNVQQALQGLAPGVTVVDPGGVPGRSNATIRVRGVTTLNNSDPLVIVDGIEQKLAEINPQDIESISVLKDAASTSIYGSRAANGVILVTTKRGRSGKVRVNLNTAFSLQRTINSPQMMDTRDYMEEQAIAYKNAGSPVPPKFTEDSINKWVNATDRYQYPLPNTWYQSMFHTAPRIDNTLSVSGGNEKFKTYLSARYLNEDGILNIPHSTQQKLRDVRANATYKVSSKINISFDVSERYNYSVTPHNLAGNVFDMLHSGTLWVVPKYPDGTYGLSAQGRNPRLFAEQGGTDKQTYDITTAILKGEWEIIRGLKFSTQFGVRTEYFQESDYANAFRNTDSIKHITRVVTPNSLTETRNFLREYTVNNLLNYETSIGLHDIKFLVGNSEINNQQNRLSAFRQNFYNNDIQSIDAGANDGTQSNGGFNSQFGLSSFFGRVNYTYNNKYFAEANARYDGSSRFTGKNQYSFFPSFSGGWRLSEEKFWKGIKKTVNELKFRGSWGKTGNQSVGLYSYYDALVPNTYTFGGQPVTGYGLNTLSNNNITWETTKQADIGLDATIFNNLSVTMDYYYKRTNDILLTLPIPLTVGLNAPPQNAGVVDNKGIEIGISYKNSIGSKFRYNLAGNFTVNNNKVVDLVGTGPYITYQIDPSYAGQNNGLDPRFITKVGLPINSFWGYKTDGLFQTQEEINKYPTYVANTKPGDTKFVDLNGDGKVNSDDYTMLGTSFPKYTYALNTNFGYRNFELNLFLQGAADVSTSLTGPMAEMGNNEGFTYQLYTDYWTPANPNAEFPRPIKGDLHNRITSDQLVLNASYIKLKNIQVIYNLGETIAKKIYADKVSFYASMTNVFTISPLNRWHVDPETPPTRLRNYPQTSMMTFGLNIQF